MRIKVIVPVPVGPEAVARRAAQIPSELRDHDTEVTFVSVKNSCANFDSEHDHLLADFFVYEEGASAQEDGYDAVCIETTSDSGMAALRSRLDVPVVGAGIAAYYVALMLGQRFSVITTSEVWSLSPYKFLRRLGIVEHLASVRYIDVRPDLEKLIGDDKSEIFPALERIARDCIEIDGADVIVLGSTSLHEAYDYLRERLPVPVISPGLVAYKVARMLVELGLSQSRHAYRQPQAPKDDVFHAAAAAVNVRPKA